MARLNVSAWSIRNPIPSVLGFLLLVVGVIILLVRRGRD